ncbi:MAG: asparagine synthase (glutamine-hydrolyzing) [Sulfuritalea sp.]|nr:asparagine synthase (glutamine-hydrolyzing) [Sulfuritalea sp.]
MCGILGYSGVFDTLVMRKGLDAIAHRGPDDSGQFFDEQAGVGLGHVRLSIIELSSLGHQPMVDESATLAIVFNGEIYNFRDLRLQLEAQGTIFRGHSDTEVLLALYKAHGEAMLPLLNGIFAFAIFDRVAQTIFLACDAMAVKPLYFATVSKGFVFASELKALVAVNSETESLDILALYRTLGFLWSPGGATPLSGKTRLGPGEALLVTAGRILRRWSWAPSSWGGAPIVLDAEEAVRKVQTTLRNAVHRQLVADVPVGAFLSGGLDSSAVVAMAREVSPEIECFTIDTGEVRDTGVTDDLPYARQVAKHLGVKLHEIRVDSLRMAESIERMVIQLDEPLADPAPLNVLYISQLARDHGIKVLLSGAGGDDLFTGYRRHRALMLEPYWSWLPSSMRQALSYIAGYIPKQRAMGRRFAKAFTHAGLPAEKRLVGYFLWSDPSLVLGLFMPEHRAVLAGEVMTAPMEDYVHSLPHELSPLQRMLALEQRFFLPDHNLLYTDKMSMAVGVEVRVPFLDNDLVQLANMLPSKFKQRGAEGKWVLKKAMEPFLPRNVIYRPKTGFGAPLRHWLRYELREWVGDILSPQTLRRRGLFDPKAVAALVAADRAGHIDAAYTILGLVCIEIWCREYIDNASTIRAARG